MTSESLGAGLEPRSPGSDTLPASIQVPSQTQWPFDIFEAFSAA